VEPSPRQPGREGEAGGPRPPRRKRYSGTHPRRFGQKYKERDPQAHPGLHERFHQKGKTPAGTHRPVLLREVLRWLRPAPGEVVVDCTVGFGGHAAEFLRQVGAGGLLVGLDVDGEELERTRVRLAGLGMPLRLHRRNFAGLLGAIREEGLTGADIVFADLGVSSMQIDDPARGMSYKHDGPLDLRMDARLAKTGADWLATLSREDLSAALRDLADEPDHERLAEWIVRQRQVQPIATTTQLARLLLNAKGFSPRDRRTPPWEKPGGLHPAARTFQALRMLVNDELGSLRELLRVAPSVLRPGGRIGILSFHSGEDRIVKRAFREGREAGVYSVISEEVIRPGGEEVRANPRSASAKFRWARAP
jgi:16S rRNA (cytosine1402-N4)-methyltransferase